MSFFNTTPSSGASSGSLFGTAGNAFGANKDNNASGGGVFGNVGASSGGSSATPSLFGGNAAGQNTPSFGNTGTANATTGGSSGFSFGGQAKTGAPTGNSLFGGAGSQTPNKPAESTTPGQPANNGLFGGAGAPKAGGSMFGSTATPAPAGGSLFGNNSTTPAGPPPGLNPPNSLFAAAKPASATPSTAATSTTPTTSQPSNNLFGGAASKPSFGGAAPTPAAPAGGLFSANKPAETTTPAATADTGAKPLFGAAPGGQTPSLFNKAPAPGGDAASKPAFPAFGGATSATPSTTPSLGAPATSSATPQKPMFSIGGATSTAAPSTTPAAAPSGGLFGGAGSSAPSTTAGTAATTAPTTTSAAPAGGLFGQGAAATPSTKPATTSAAPLGGLGAQTTAAPAPATAAPAAGAAPSGPSALGQSTTGPAPPAQSRLKNKTMDEIITRWATDLGKYQKDFREQAEKVSEWDRLLVDNGTKVQKLYGSTVDADRATQEVERQLSAVEGQQDELSSWLDRYEREVDEMVTKQVGPGESLQGPDQEREATYKLAEKLSERLDEMGKDLTSMIEEVNSASSTLSKTNKADEPISQIVRILNAHLSQLQVIDQGTSELQGKVAAAQKAGQSISARLGYGYNNTGMGNDSTADDFYRSFMQGR
ncbi:uncharacterized protein N7529_005629 [Penicillium soppii]|uniref:uncharacterized protein n=1 Tax=Penicillium soppii TaxID=69789 RepID=UPI002546F141|nr:uncharacterized protein N7529_005629 [Penicillium soppii]KAJ5863713.1 hypothetical protein N7529_005629 [Penicillium soppii]